MKQGNGKITPIAPGLLQRVARGVKYMVSGVDGIKDWMGPGQPLMPVAQEESVGRLRSYPVGVNTRITARDEESGISHQEMRRLADSYDILRLVIESQKNKLSAETWKIQLRDQKGDGTDPRIKVITDFLSSPDGEHTWVNWLSSLVEDMYVIDAATVYPRRDRAGRLLGLDVIQGETIRRVFDERGATPASPNPAYQQILHGVVAADYTRDQLLYMPRNVRSHRGYGFSHVEQIILTVNIALRRQIHKLQYYTDGSTPDLILQAPLGWNPDQILNFMNWWNDLLSGDTANRRRTLFVPNGASPINTKEAALKDEFDEWLARVVCFAFSVSPQPFIKEMNRATAQTGQQSSEQEGLEPIKKWVKSVLDRILREVFQAPDLEFMWQERNDVDALKLAQVNELKVRSGAKTIDDWRAIDGEEPLPDGLGAEPLIYTATGAMRLRDIVFPPPPPPPPVARGHNGGPPLNDDGTPGVPNPEADTPTPPNPEAANPEVDADPTEKLAKADAEDPEIPVIPHDRPVVRIGTKALERLWTHALAVIGIGVSKRAAAAYAEITKADEADDKGDETAADATGGNVEKVVDAAMSGADWVDIQHETVSVLAEVAQDSAQQAIAGVVVVIPTTVDAAATTNLALGVANPHAVAWASEHAAELITGIDETTRSILRGIIVEAEKGGWSVNTLANKIVESSAFSKPRARLIAQTEMSYADNNGSLIGWRAMTASCDIQFEKIWMLGTAETSCAICVGNSLNGPVPLEEPFPSGDLVAPAHPLCVCTCSVARIKDDSSLKKAAANRFRIVLKKPYAP